MTKTKTKTAPAPATAGKPADWPEGVAWHEGATIAEARFVAAREAGLSMLREAGKLAAGAGEAAKVANEKRATALDTAIAGLCAEGVMAMPFTFDVCDKAGQVIEHCNVTLADYLLGFHNKDGSDNRGKQSAFRATILPLFFGVAGDQSTGAKATWALFTGKALPAAAALVARGMKATLNPEGGLVVEGGEGEEADKLRAAAGRSASALAKAAKGETGTDRDAPQNDKAGDLRAATPGEIAIAALGIAKRIVKGEEAATNTALSTFRELAKLIASNPEAFAED